MTTAGATVDALRREWPAWAPWLAGVAETLRECADPQWRRMVPREMPPWSATAPLLAGTTLVVDLAAVHAWVARLFRVASIQGGSRMARAAGAVAGEADSIALFAAALSQDRAPIEGIARARDVDAEALHALAALVPVPFLQACHRQWARSKEPSWTRYCCPVCGAWPAFAEERGDERRRQFRCGRCGDAWSAQLLCCPFCETTDHEAMVLLLPDEATTHGSIDACQRCLGYVKRFATLEPCLPEAVMLQDLASVDLDVAALGQGYRRPQTGEVRLDVRVA